MEKLCAQLWWQLRHVTQCLHVNTFSSKTSGNDNVNSTQSLRIMERTIITTNGNVSSSGDSRSGNIKASRISIVYVVIITIIIIIVIVVMIIVATMIIKIITEQQAQLDNDNDP